MMKFLKSPPLQNQAKAHNQFSVVGKPFLSLFLPVTALIGMGLASFYQIQANLIRSEIANTARREVEVKTALSTHRFNSIRADLMVLAKQHELQVLLDPTTPQETMRPSQAALSEEYLVTSQQKRQYDQIRFLDTTGQEVVRVNFNRGQPRIVPEVELQNQSHRYWFKDTLALPKDQVFISPLDLNIDFGKIEQPLKPMIRFGTPVFDQQGHEHGIVVLNYLAEKLLKELSQANSLSFGQVCLLNAEGYWLKDTNPENEWGFMYDDRHDRTFAKAFPATWQQIRDQQTGQFQTAEGLYTFATIYPLLDIYKDLATADSTNTIGSSADQIKAKSYYWKLVIHVPMNILTQRSQAIRDQLLFSFLGLTGLVAIGTGLLAQAKIRRQHSEQEAKKRTTELQQIKAASAASEATSRAKSEFLANMSHELRTPLNGILGYAQILGRSPALSDPERHGVNVIYQCGTHLLSLINDVLDLAKVEALRLELSPQPLHLSALLQRVVEMCQIRAEQKELDFHYELDASLPTGVVVDAKRLQQVLINLLGNAIKFTDRGSVSLRIEQLSLDPDSTCLRFWVSDTGVGIAPDQLNQLFHAFGQVGDQSRRAEGTGLGLAISQQIVQLMGGQIQVRSQLGQGSAFYFTVELPLAVDWQPPQVPQHRQIVGYAGAPRQILVVDDRWENRAVLTDLLAPLGFIMTEAENGQAALTQIRQQLPDLVITDLVMPVTDGITMLQQLRGDPALPALKVIASAAALAPTDQQISREAGGDDFLSKPVQAEALFQLLAHHLQLTWVYAETPPDPDSVPMPTELTPPPLADLQRLLELVQKGRLQQVMILAEAIGQRDERHQAFTQQVLRLAKKFQSERIEELIQPYLIPTPAIPE